MERFRNPLIKFPKMTRKLRGKLMFYKDVGQVPEFLRGDLLLTEHVGTTVMWLIRICEVLISSPGQITSASFEIFHII